MIKTFTFFLQKYFFYSFKIKTFALATGLFCFLLTAGQVNAGEADSSNSKKPIIVNELERCRIPTSMIMRIKHLSPVEIKELNEEYQHTDITEGGLEIVTIVKLRFIDDHITGYIKEVLLSNSERPQSINYIDIPIEWMCIPPKRDHPFHFATALSELDSIKEENGCLAWVQRDNEVIIKFAQQKEKKKRSNKNNP